MKTILTIMLACLATGCISIHKVNELTIIARVEAPGEPASGYPVKVEYLYDHYGCLFLRYLNEPKPIEANLNARGEIKLLIADFWDPYLEVGSTAFLITTGNILHGGILELLPHQPDKRFPRVSVKIIKENPTPRR